MEDDNQEDWRLSFLADYLVGITFWRATYRQPSERWDHDHCMGCFAKFSERDLPGDKHRIVHEGYTTDAGPWWICDECFRDFRDHFSWQLRQPN